MKTIILSILATLAFVAIIGAAGTLININQIAGGGTGTFVLTSVNGKNAWSAPATVVVPSFSDAEVPGGTPNGTLTTFTLAHADANTGGSLILVRNGITLQGGGADYTLSGATITFTAAAVPQTGDTLQAWYRY
jgi:hypothetical protein